MDQEQYGRIQPAPRNYRIPGVKKAPQEISLLMFLSLLSFNFGINNNIHLVVLLICLVLAHGNLLISYFSHKVRLKGHPEVNL